MTLHLLRCARCKEACCAQGGRREFHWVPNHGAAAINRQISWCNRLGDIDMDQEATLLQFLGTPASWEFGSAAAINSWVDALMTKLKHAETRYGATAIECES